ncbi:ParB/RepB/Spo0J family partition protein [Mobiluncus mulieris]|uniref:ParB/RepB/Spo0J family partition protein n=1 Tax=Mobiluncus mulieris TaxID=2052 RepID=UPI00146FF6F1|nr:ParB/RepB/Spo0J family partition protein [Mobiluncus mulieris]NMW74269.1 ParB/RepB/Spo0J family partition protein [Mobiluncus mulieris]
MAKKRALGSGLGALIPPAPASRGVDVIVPPKHGSQASPEDAKVHDLLNPRSPRTQTKAKGNSKSKGEPELVAVPGMRMAELPLQSVVPNPNQPREVFDEEALRELAESIKSVGVLQPIVVRPLEDSGGESRYELVMGERRWRASKLAGKRQIPAIIRETADEDMRRDALLENLQRVNLNPLEEAAAYQQMIAEFGITQELLAKKLSRSRPQISNTLRLLKLPATVQVKVAAGVISAGHARALLGIGNHEAMAALADRIVAEGLSVRATEEIVSLGEAEKPKRERKPRVKPALSEHLMESKTKLEDLLQTRVNLQVGKHKGSISIEFADEADLNRIVEFISRR